MNTIKNSFSKIKASDEFKGKLLRELQASQTKLNKSTEKTLYKSNDLNSLVSPKEHLVTRKIYYKQYIAAAATFFIVIGTISFKLIIPGFEKGNTNSEVIAYAPQAEPATENDHLTESYDKANNNNNNNADISSQSAKTDISSEKAESDVVSKNTETNLTYKKTESAAPSVKNETNLNAKVENNMQAKINENNSSSKIIKDSTSSTSEIPVSKNDAAPNTEAPLTRNAMSDEKDNSANLANSDNTMNPISGAPPLTSGIMSENGNVTENASVNSIYVPKIELPKASMYATAKMRPLIIYKGNIYIHTSIQTSSEEAKNLLGQKLGTTKNTIDEWSSKSAYSNELASNIGTTDVYSVKGYDETFRIMTNSKVEDGTNFTEFYECLNGITITKGDDIFSKLKLQDNVVEAKFQTYDDWNNVTGTFYPINNNELLKNLFNEINQATPYLSEDIEASLGDYRNEDGYKQISFDLKDGLKNVTLTILKSGYIYYDSAQIYLKIDPNFAEELWNNLNIMKIN